MLTVTNLLIQVLSILSSIKLARQLQPHGYGVFNLILMQASIFSIFATYGLRIVIIRSIARNKSNGKKIYEISSRIRILTTVVSLVIVTGYNYLQKENSLSGGMVLSLLLIIIGQTIWDTIESLAFGYERMEASGIINLIFTVIWILEIYLIPDSLFFVGLLTYIFVLNQIIKTFVYRLWIEKKILTRYIGTEEPIYPEDYKNMLRDGSSYFILAIFTAVQNQVPILFLQFNSRIDQIGIFNLGYRILSPLQMVLGMLLTAIFPMLARQAIEKKELFVKRIKNLLNIITIVGIWGSVGFTFFSMEIVKILYGEKYLGSATVIVIQCWFTVLFAIFCTIGTVLNSIDKQRLLAILSIIYGIISLPIFYWGSKYGAIGLAWAFVIAALINMIYHLIIFKKLLKPYLSFRYTVTVFILLTAFAMTPLFKIEFSIIWRIILLILLSYFGYYFLKREYDIISSEVIVN